MEGRKSSSAERRARTDASLDAERARTGVDTNGGTTASAQRLLDDLIERDRVLADERLVRFRERADSRLARERDASPSTDSTVALERDASDERSRAERELTDDLRDRERRRADTLAQTERGVHEVERAQQEAERQDTDDRLSLERNIADVTARALGDARHALAHALAHARTEESRRSEVLAVVTHDLRSPLAVIGLNAAMIAEDTEDASTRDAAEQVSLAAARMGRLLTDLLDVARIESGTFHVAPESHDAGMLLTEVKKSYGPLFANRHMKFEVEVPGAEVLAWFDHDRMVQVLSNLLGNALKFTPAEGTVRLRLEALAGQVQFVLQNSGPGIAPGALPHVFERFWQIDSTARRGLGLGLYICEKIVAAHGGRIWAESAEGEGATFRFTLRAA